MHILRRRRVRERDTVSFCVPEHGEPGLDEAVRRVEIVRTGIRINGVVDLIVARFVQAAEIEPYFRNEGIETNRTGVCVQGVSVLIDLVVEHTNGAPECRVLAISVHGLLICFIGLVVFLTLHERSSKQVPALCIGRISFQTFGEVGDCGVLIGKGGTRLVIEPTELLQDFGVIGIVLQYTLVRVLSSVILKWPSARGTSRGGVTHVFLLLVDVSNLEPDVDLGQRFRRIVQDIAETLQGISIDLESRHSTHLETGLEFLLRLVYDAEPKVYLVCLVKVYAG